MRTVKKKSAQSVLYLIWRKPWMAAGSGTFIDSMLTMLNLKNAIGEFSEVPGIISGTNCLAQARLNLSFIRALSVSRKAYR